MLRACCEDRVVQPSDALAGTEIQRLPPALEEQRQLQGGDMGSAGLVFMLYSLLLDLASICILFLYPSCFLLD